MQFQINSKEIRKTQQQKDNSGEDWGTQMFILSKNILGYHGSWAEHLQSVFSRARFEGSAFRNPKKGPFPSKVSDSWLRNSWRDCSPCFPEAIRIPLTPRGLAERAIRSLFWWHKLKQWLRTSQAKRYSDKRKILLFLLYFLVLFRVQALGVELVHLSWNFPNFSK